MAVLQPIIQKSYLFELNLGTPANQKRINFQYVPQLEGATIYGIQMFSISDVTLSPNGLVPVTTLGLAGCTVTFAVLDEERIYILPCSDLRSINIFGFQRMFADLKINLTKSYITIQDSTNLLPNGVILTNFIYKK